MFGLRVSAFRYSAQRYSTFLQSPSWSIKEFLSTQEESSDHVVAKEDLIECANLSKLAVDTTPKLIVDVQKVIQCAKNIDKVDVSSSKFILTDYEKKTGQVLGMVSPIHHTLQLRDDNDKTTDHAKQWNLESMKQNALNTTRMEGNLFAVPKMKETELDE